MKFKGDIIITDPCYIMKKPNVKYPNYKDFGISDELYNKDPAKQTKEEKEMCEKYMTSLNNYWDEYNKFDDWSRCEYGDRLDVLGIKNYLCSSTEYGDWSCTTVLDTDQARKLIREKKDIYLKFFNEYNFTGKNSEEQNILSKKYQEDIKSIDEKISLGNFCADAGLVAVFLLDEVLKYNPDFNYHLERPHTTTLIKDFDGDISITHRNCKHIDEETGEEMEGEEEEVSVVGIGNINFYTTQTGF